MAQWIETKLRYNKVMENGAVKKVTEAYLVTRVRDKKCYKKVE